MFLSVLIAILLVLPAFVFGQEGFVPLVGIPGLTDSVNGTQAYFDFLYRFAIVAAAFMAVVKILFAGIKYMFTDVPGVKSDAKGDIGGALLGLAIVLGAVIILETINPNLTNFTLFQNVPAPIKRVVVHPGGAPATCPTTCPEGTVITPINPGPGQAADVSRAKQACTSGSTLGGQVGVPHQGPSTGSGTTIYCTPQGGVSEPVQKLETSYNPYTGGLHDCIDLCIAPTKAFSLPNDVLSSEIYKDTLYTNFQTGESGRVDILKYEKLCDNPNPDPSDMHWCDNSLLECKSYKGVNMAKETTLADGRRVVHCQVFTSPLKN